MLFTCVSRDEILALQEPLISAKCICASSNRLSRRVRSPRRATGIKQILH